MGNSIDGKVIGSRFKTLREQVHLTQKEFAERCNVTQSMINYYENGRTIPTTKNLVNISNIFNISVEWLLGRIPVDSVSPAVQTSPVISSVTAIGYVPLNELKIVYFDVDGVLSVPRYPLGKDRKIVPFTENPRWDRFVDNNINAYSECYAPVALKAWIGELKDAGIPVCILSATTEDEMPSKMKFILDNYGDSFSKIKFVSRSADKKPYMIEQQAKLGYDPFEMALVEDNHNTLFDIAEAGFRGIHVSWFLDCVVPHK